MRDEGTQVDPVRRVFTLVRRPQKGTEEIRRIALQEIRAGTTVFTLLKEEDLPPYQKATQI